MIETGSYNLYKLSIDKSLRCYNNITFLHYDYNMKKVVGALNNAKFSKTL